MSTLRQIVVGFDASPHSEMGLFRALKEAQRAHIGIVHVLCVVHKTPHSLRLPSGRELSHWAAKDYLRHTISVLLESWSLMSAEALVSIHLKHEKLDPDKIASSIVGLAYLIHADQIIVGSQGHSVKMSPRVGTVAEAVLALSEIPVHLESPSHCEPRTHFNPLRWAQVFGGFSSLDSELDILLAKSRA